MTAWTERLDDFLMERKSRGASPRTIDWYRALLLPFATSLNGSLDVHDVRRHMVSLMERGVKPHGFVRAVRAWTHFLEEEGVCAHMPIKMPPNPNVHRPLPSAADYRRVVGLATQRERVALYFLADTGLRRQEAVSVRWADVDLQTGKVVVLTTKGGEPRVVFVGQETRRLLAWWKRRSKSVCVLGLTAWGLRSMLVRVGRRAGVDLSAHQLRRFFATEALRNGCDVLSLQRLLGHKSLAMTTIYVRLTSGDLAAVHERVSPIDRL